MNLNGCWKLYYYPHGSVQIDHVKDLAEKNIAAVPGTVPGNVELDLSAAGILPKDLYKGENILTTEPFEAYDWWYETAFVPNEPQNGQEVLLHFGAVDCVADYYLNGQKIGSSDNMFIAQDFEVTKLLNYGKSNTLHVHITSPLAAVKDTEYDLDMISLSWMNHQVSADIRKAPHSYGWDIMPRALSAGIWRPVELVYRDQSRFKFVHFELKNIEPSKGFAELCFQASLPVAELYRPHCIVVRGRCGDKSFEQKGTVMGNGGRFYFDIPDIQLWWPKNYGEPNLYDITVSLYNNEEVLLAETKLRQGFRTLELRRSSTVEKGGGFEFMVNGVKIMIVGTNWVPMDAFHSRDEKRYQKALEMAVDIGCNMLRCWGGNVYEDDAFFEFCDEHGLLVWQDFAMACCYYPQSEAFAEKLRREVTAVVKKLRNYACLAVWCGDNEIDYMVKSYQRKPSRNRLTREVIPQLLQRLDPYRPYIESSPFVPDEALDGAALAEDHLWGPRDYFKSEFYTGSKAYFVSETGYHGCPAKSSIERFIDPEFVWPYTDNCQWNLHSSDQQNSDARTMLMHRQVQQLFGKVPADMEEYIMASQISQAEAKKFFIERVRAKMDTMGGVLWWNLVDGWPQMSDAVVDYYYEKKLAYDYIRRSSYPVIVLVGEMEPWGHPVLVANGTQKAAQITVSITDLASGQVIYNGGCTAAANSNTRMDKLPMMYADKGMLLIRYTVDQKPFINTYLYGSPAFSFAQYKGFLQQIEQAEKELQ